MQSLAIRPIPHPLQAAIRVPGSKSLTNRALLIAALAHGTTRLENALFSDDSRHFATALQTLGFDVEWDQPHRQISVTGLGGRIPANQAALQAGNAGTAVRFLSAFLALGHGDYTLDGDSRMRERPLGDLIHALQQLGVDIAALHHNNCPPVRIQASGLPGGKTEVSGEISSQFLSALLMSAPYARQPVEITVTGELNSQPYVAMTLAIMQQFGVPVEQKNMRHFHVSQGRYQPKDTYTIESDASAASYFFAAPLICNGSITVQNISRTSMQGDIAFLDVLVDMGANIQREGNQVTVSNSGQPRGVDVDMRNIPDTAQTLAVIAPFCSSPTRIHGIASARLKETDRILATCAELRKLGVPVEEFSDGMLIHPREDLRPARIATYNDHRMAMSFSLIGLRIPGITIENPGCVAKTFPNFFETLEQLQ